MRALALLCACLVTLATVGCGDKGPTRKVDDATVMKEVLLRQLPVGTPIGEAQKFMEQEGFKCVSRKNRTFSEAGTDHEDIDYLYCTRTDEVTPPALKRKWHIAVVENSDAVADVLISTRLIEEP